MAIQNKTQRIFYRNETSNFQVSFFADVANTIPLIPIDVGLYPAYTIYDLNNVAIQSGIGNAYVSPGTYKVDFLVPADAPLSYDDKRWRIEWQIVTDSNRQVDFVEEFDVRDLAITASKHREQKYITLSGKDFRSILRLTKRPAEVNLDVFLSGSENKIVNNVSVTGGQIIEVVEGDSYIYYYDIPGSVLQGNTGYSMIWNIRETATDITQFIYQNLSTVTPNVLEQITSVRMLIDKFQKRLGSYQSYEDSDINEYLKRGSELVNSSYPTTYYQFGYLPTTLNTFIIMMASWYGLQAQGLLEVDLGFSFSGQTVTLDYDHSGAIADIAGRWSEYVEKNLAPAKMSLVRRSSPVGTVAGRGYRYSDMYNLTYKVASWKGGPGNIMSQMNHLGLLW